MNTYTYYWTFTIRQKQQSFLIPVLITGGSIEAVDDTIKTIVRNLLSGDDMLEAYSRRIKVSIMEEIKDLLKKDMLSGKKVSHELLLNADPETFVTVPSAYDGWKENLPKIRLGNVRKGIKNCTLLVGAVLLKPVI